MQKVFFLFDAFCIFPHCTYKLKSLYERAEFIALCTTKHVEMNVETCHKNIDKMCKLSQLSQTKIIGRQVLRKMH